jgi:hypothetical protein
MVDSSKEEVMVSKQHCPVCGFLMMYSVEENKTTYTCVNSHGTIGKADQGVHMSEGLAEAYRSLGSNVDILMEYLKRP